MTPERATLETLTRVEGKVDSICRTVGRHDSILQGSSTDEPGLLTIVYTLRKDMRSIHKAAWLVFGAIVTFGGGMLATALVALFKFLSLRPGP